MAEFKQLNGLPYFFLSPTKSGEDAIVLLADRTNGRAIGTVLRLSVVCRLWRYVLWLNGAS